MGTEQRSEDAAPDAGVSAGVWVRHGDTITWFHMACPDAHPYTTVMWARGNTGWRPGDPASPMSVHRVDGSALTVLGGGASPEDPMHCPELRDEPTPRCRCSEVAESLPDPDDGDDPEPAGEHWDPQPVRPPAPPTTVRRMTTVHLPGDGPR